MVTEVSPPANCFSKLEGNSIMFLNDGMSCFIYCFIYLYLHIYEYIYINIYIICMCVCVYIYI